jgi:hypothetical protein
MTVPWFREPRETTGTDPNGNRRNRADSPAASSHVTASFSGSGNQREPNRVTRFPNPGGLVIDPRFGTGPTSRREVRGV